MESKQKYPGPLQLDRSAVVDGMGTYFGTFVAFKDEMAEEILRRYNAHNALVAALQKIDKWITDDQIRGRVLSKNEKDIREAVRATFAGVQS